MPNVTDDILMTYNGDTRHIIKEGTVNMINDIYPTTVRVETNQRRESLDHSLIRTYRFIVCAKPNF